MIFKYKYNDRISQLEIEDTRFNANDPYSLQLNSIKDVAWAVEMLLGTVLYEDVVEAIDKCANELGCVYSNVNELVEDINRFYI